MGDSGRYNEMDRRNTVPMHIHHGDAKGINEVSLLSSSKLKGLSPGGNIKINTFHYSEHKGPSPLKRYHYSLYDRDRAWWNSRGTKHYVDGEYVYFLGRFHDHPQLDPHSYELLWTPNRTFEKLTETEDGFIFLIRDTEKRTETKTIEDENGLPIEEVTETTYHYNYLQWNFQGETYRENSYRFSRDSSVRQWDNLLPVTDAPVAISETASNELKQNKDIDGDGKIGAASLTVGVEDVIYGSNANDTFNGGKGDDFIAGREGNDVLNGGKGDDLLFAGSGNDELYGGLGSDVLTGGEGSDRFEYGDIKESAQGVQSRDVITDFSSSEDDKIDLSAIADDSVFIGSADFTGTKSEIRFDDGILQLAAPDFYTPLFKYFEPDSAPTPVFEIQLLGVDSLSVDDFILSDLSDWDHNDFRVEFQFPK